MVEKAAGFGYSWHIYNILFIFLFISLSQDDSQAALGSVSAWGTGYILLGNILVFVQLMQMESGQRKIPYFIIELVCSTHSAAHGESTTLSVV